MNHSEQAQKDRQAEHGGRPREIPFFIDGERYTTAEEQLTVEALLALVGKSADGWYLVERHGRNQTEYRAGEVVTITPGAKFLTVSTGPTPVS
jgi:hypothetical protein